VLQQFAAVPRSEAAQRSPALRWHVLDRFPGESRLAARPGSDESEYYALGLDINVEAFNRCLPN